MSEPRSTAKVPHLGPDLRALVIGAVVAVGTAFGAYRYVVGEAKAQVDSGVEQLAAKHEDLRREVERYERSADASIADVRRDVGEVKHQVAETQADIRSLYKAVMSGQRQERLERPAGVDGGWR